MLNVLVDTSNLDPRGTTLNFLGCCPMSVVHVPQHGSPATVCVTHGGPKTVLPVDYIRTCNKLDAIPKVIPPQKTVLVPR
jgi:hypothetical protein